MWRWIWCASIVFCSWPTAKAQFASDKRTFLLSAVGPAVPALKYGLLFDPADQHAGNAAPLYRDAETIWGTPYDQIDEFESHHYSDAQYPAAAETLYQKNQRVFVNLDAAARCDQCDWQIGVREEGIQARLPYLNSMRGLSELLCIRAHQMTLTGDVGQAIANLRLGYQLTQNCAKGEFIVSGLVACGIVVLLNDELAHLMNRPDAPNLYWELAAMPKPMFSLHDELASERVAEAATLKEIAGANLDDFSGEELRTILKRIVNPGSNGKGPQHNPLSTLWNDDQALAADLNENLPAAQQYYAQTRSVPLEQAQAMDPFKMVAIYWYEQARDVCDQSYAASALPYPLAQPLLDQLGQRVARLRSAQPANLFLDFIASYGRALRTYCYADRQLAALANVEAIRSYAAAHAGTLPADLGDISDTPALENPRTGESFNYAVHGDTAILSDPLPANDPLVFTVQIRP